MALRTSGAVQIEHNAACEHAAQADCHCRCHGAGHQNDLVARAASCSNVSDLSQLHDDLERVLGGFHSGIRDIGTATRTARSVPTAKEIAKIRLTVGKGATWYETLILDEALHAAFLLVASRSMTAAHSVRRDQEQFADRITIGAINVVGSPVFVSNVVESHVWCSIVAEYVASLTPASTANPHPTIFDDISYPRRSQGRRPTSLGAVRGAGLNHLASAQAAFKSIPPEQRLDVLRLVGSATCPDLWHHAAVVRFCISPFVASKSWPPSGTTKVASVTNLDSVARRWRRKGHW